MFGALVLPYNESLTGRPLAFPIQAYDDEHFGRNSDAYGFGPHVGMGWALQPFPSQGHTPLAGLVNANLNAFSTNIELFGWSTGSIILATLILVTGKKQRGDYLMIAVITATVALYFPYYFSGGPDFGARYWYLIIVPLAVLTVRGIDVLREKVDGLSADNRIAGMRVIAAVVVLCLFAMVNYFPWRSLDKYYHYLDMRPDIASLANTHSFGRSLVLVQGDSYPDYASATVFNSLNLSSNATVYAWDRNPQVRAAVIQAYADRPIWIVAGPTLTHAGYRVVAGPLSAKQVLSGQAEAK